MSIQAVAWVLEESEATLADRLVLIAIANHADAKGWNAWPSIPLIAREARVDERTVYRAIEALEQRGELVVERRPGRPNRYAISAIRGGNLSGVAPDKLPGVPLTSTTKRGDRMSPEPSRTVKDSSRERVREVPRCADCGHLTAACTCQKIDTERSLEWVRALRRGETPAS